MNQRAMYSQSFTIKGGDFINAGTVSVRIKRLLKEIGLKPDIIYRAAICCYEAEMNVVMYANEATLDFTITVENITVKLSDKGPGIKNIELAMKEGYSTATEKMREMGFGAGMGLPNIKNNADVFEIESEIAKGTIISFKINLNGKH
ncbi:MAG: anti-sigma regulatory factor [Ignavibacteriae bacterium]|nr:MAG: anti-sigma regulatory factor [Ignavibacteriota bacterium]